MTGEPHGPQGLREAAVRHLPLLGAVAVAMHSALRVLAASDGQPNSAGLIVRTLDAPVLLMGSLVQLMSMVGLPLSLMTAVAVSGPRRMRGWTLLCASILLLLSVLLAPAIQTVVMVGIGLSILMTLGTSEELVADWVDEFLRGSAAPILAVTVALLFLGSALYPIGPLERVEHGDDVNVVGRVYGVDAGFLLVHPTSGAMRLLPLETVHSRTVCPEPKSWLSPLPRLLQPSQETVCR